MDGAVHEHRTDAVRGTPDNPMSQDEVEAKARDLTAPVLGERRAEGVIEGIRNLEAIDNVQHFRQLLSA